MPRGPRPRRRGDQHHCAADEEMPLPPDPARGHAHESREPYAEKEVPRQQGDGGEVEAVPYGEGEGVGREDGAEAGREDGG